LRSYSPGGVLNALAAALRGGNPLTLSTHRLRRGLPGYLILFDPHAFAHQRQLQTRKSPSPLVFRGFLIRYRQGAHSYLRTCSSLITELYDPKTFITHAALLRQAFAHCGRFPTAASRRSLDRVSVPVWPITLSGRLRIVALVSRYLTN
jgi:hypothetical protein